MTERDWNYNLNNGFDDLNTTFCVNLAYLQPCSNIYCNYLRDFCDIPDSLNISSVLYF